MTSDLLLGVWFSTLVVVSSFILPPTLVWLAGGEDSL